MSGYPWGEGRPGVERWRASFADHAAAEREFRDGVDDGLLVGYGEPGPVGRVVVDEVSLRGGFPETKVIVIFRAEAEAPGHRFGCWAWVWGDPDTQSDFTPYFYEFVNEFQPLRPHPDARPGDLTWLYDAPPPDKDTSPDLSAR